MMLHLLAQTTQQIVTSTMKNWGPFEWTIFFTALGTLLGGFIASVSAAIIAVLRAGRAEVKSDLSKEQSDKAQATADTAHIAAAEARGAAADQTGRLNNLGKQLGDIALQTAPRANLESTPQPQAATPEQIRNGLQHSPE